MDYFATAGLVIALGAARHLVHKRQRMRWLSPWSFNGCLGRTFLHPMLASMVTASGFAVNAAQHSAVFLTTSFMA
jgi:hypothetical protein